MKRTTKLILEFETIVGKSKNRPQKWIHSLKCTAREQTHYDAVDNYELLWPDYCKTCFGTGIVEGGGDSVPYGSTNVSLPTYDDPCDCTENGKCPRCGVEIFPEDPKNAHLLNADQIHWDKLNDWFEDGSEPCPHCDWNWNHSAGDFHPNAYDHDECGCFSDYIRLNQTKEEIPWI